MEASNKKDVALFSEQLVFPEVYELSDIFLNVITEVQSLGIPLVTVQKEWDTFYSLMLFS